MSKREIELTYPIRGMGAVRMTRRGKFVSERAKKYIDYQQEIRLRTRGQFKGDVLTGALEVECNFYFKAPKSYPKKKVLLAIKGMLHFVKKPDVDNLFKGVTDSLNGVVYEDDRFITHAIISKEYAEEDYIKVRVKELGE